MVRIFRFCPPLIHFVRDKIKQSKRTVFLKTNSHRAVRTEYLGSDINDNMTKPCACPDQLILILDSAKHNNNEAFIVNTMHYEGGGGGGLNPVWSEIFLLSDGQTGLDSTPLRAGYCENVSRLKLLQKIVYFSPSSCCISATPALMMKKMMEPGRSLAWSVCGPTAQVESY